EIGHPRNVASACETAGDNKPGISRSTGKDDLGLPFFKKLFAGGHRGFDPVGANVGNVDHSQVVSAERFPKRSRTRASLRMRILAPLSRWNSPVAAQQTRRSTKPMLALMIFSIRDPFSRVFER